MQAFWRGFWQHNCLCCMLVFKIFKIVITILQFTSSSSHICLILFIIMEKTKQKSKEEAVVVLKKDKSKALLTSASEIQNGKYLAELRYHAELTFRFPYWRSICCKLIPRIFDTNLSCTWNVVYIL